MKTYRSYKETEARIDTQLRSAREQATPLILREVQECVREYGFTPGDIFGENAGIKVRRRARYLNPVTGQTWTGMGNEPKWLRGQDKEKFRLP